MIERKINGQKRVFQAPLKARLTEKGLQTLNEFGQASKKYEGVTYNQLVQKVHRSESDIDRLQESLETFRK